MQNVTFLYKTPSQKPMLLQIEWEVQNGPLTTSGAATNYPNVHFRTIR